MTSKQDIKVNYLVFKSYFDFDKMIFFGIVFVLYFLKLSGTSRFLFMSDISLLCNWLNENINTEIAVFPVFSS